MKVRMLSGYSDHGGSTVALINLCNALNERGHDCIFYGPHSWHTTRCRGAAMDEVEIDRDSVVIIHYLTMDVRPPVKKVVFSCHERELFDLRSVNPFWDRVVFVSESQREWHGVRGEVIPNIISDIVRVDHHPHVAGVIGSIHPNKNTHVSITKAVEHGYDEVLLFGDVVSRSYYESDVKPFVIDGIAKHMGHVDDLSEMYSMIDAVFHFVKTKETFNLVKPECHRAGVAYFGSEEAETGAIYLEKSEIVGMWEKLLQEK